MIYTSCAVYLNSPSPLFLRQVFEMEYELPLFERYGSPTSVDYLICIYKVAFVWSDL